MAHLINARDLRDFTSRDLFLEIIRKNRRLANYFLCFDGFWVLNHVPVNDDVSRGHQRKHHRGPIVWEALALPSGKIKVCGGVY